MWKEFVSSQLGNDLLAFILLCYTECVSVHLLGSPGHFDQQISVPVDNGGGMVPPGTNCAVTGALGAETGPSSTVNEQKHVLGPKHHLRGAGGGFFVLTPPSEQLLLLSSLIL